jgi:3-hydroxyacyl-CoA dehydrogenase
VLEGCDLIIEAIAERMDWKHDLYKKVAPHIGPNAIFASNTSGLSINAVRRFRCRPEGALLRRALLQPAALHAPGRTDPDPTTEPQILDQLEAFLTTTLGKGVVRAKDTPTSSPTASACSASWPPSRSREVRPVGRRGR